LKRIVHEIMNESVAANVLVFEIFLVPVSTGRHSMFCTRDADVHRVFGLCYTEKRA